MTDNDATFIMFLSPSDDKEGSPAGSAFYETGMKSNTTDEMSLYSIPIPSESETVIARVGATLVTDDGVEQRDIWVLPMRQVRETKYMSHLLAYILIIQKNPISGVCIIDIVTSISLFQQCDRVSFLLVLLLRFCHLMPYP